MTMNSTGIDQILSQMIGTPLPLNGTSHSHSSMVPPPRPQTVSDNICMCAHRALAILHDSELSIIELHHRAKLQAEELRIREILRTAPKAEHWGPFNATWTHTLSSRMRHYRNFWNSHQSGIWDAATRSDNIIKLRQIICATKGDWKRYSPVRHHPQFEASFRTADANLERWEAYHYFLLQHDQNSVPREERRQWEDGHDPAETLVDREPSVYSTIVSTLRENTPVSAESIMASDTEVLSIPFQREYAPSVLGYVDDKGTTKYTGMMTRARTRELIGMMGKHEVMRHIVEDWPEQSGRS